MPAAECPQWVRGAQRPHGVLQRVYGHDGSPNCKGTRERNRAIRITFRLYQPSQSAAQREIQMLWTVLVVILILWLLGFSFSVGGSLIHLLLVVAAVVLLFQLISGRRAV